jgi:phosphatidylethanolamine-binding protein (PEBP) family uncharacterized protein
MAAIDVRASAFEDQGPIPPRQAHDRDNVSPALEWSGVPAGTAELLLLCEDIDAPSGNFAHWLVTGIDPESAGAG